MKSTKTTKCKKDSSLYLILIIIANLPDLKDSNLNFNKAIDESIKGCVYKVVYATLTNKPDICSHCDERHINIHGCKSYNIKIMTVSGYYAILKLKNQR